MLARSLLFACGLLAACPQRSIEDTLPAYSRAYDTAFRSLGRIQLSNAQTRITALGEAGKAHQAQLDELRRGQGAVSDLLVKAVELKKQALVDKRPQGVEEGTKLLGDAEAKAQRLIASLEALEAKLTAAGAPEIQAPVRDPNARD